jgi:hypothetical protein
MPTTPAPELPTDLEQKTADYLRRFRTWATNELERRAAKDEAIQGLMFTPSASKVQPGPTSVWQLTVSATGVVSTTAMPLGTGKP